jgi:hypothetical protein
MKKKYVIYGIIAVAAIIFLIYRKKIFRDLKPTIDDLKNKIVAGEGMGGAAATQQTAGTFIKGTEGERISNMLKDVASKYSQRDLEAALRDWPSTNKTFDRSLLDNLNLSSRPVSVSELYNRNNDSQIKLENSIIDIGKLVRNQVVINDLWGHSCYCNCGCRDGFKGVTLSRFDVSQN